MMRSAAAAQPTLLPWTFYVGLWNGEARSAEILPFPQADAEPTGSPETEPDQADPVDLAGLESFPASDPPAWTGVTGAGR